MTSSEEKTTLNGKKFNQIVPVTSGSYITLQGEQSFGISQGGWMMEFPVGGGPGSKKKGCATSLQLWLELEHPLYARSSSSSSSSSKEDDKRLLPLLDQGERLYLCALGWREDAYDLGCQQMKPIFQQYQMAEQRLQEALSHESGDRRLDGTDALETLQAYGDMTQYVLDRNIKRQAYLQALQHYPPLENSNKSNNKIQPILLPEGPWPGDDQWLTLSGSSSSSSSSHDQNPMYVVKQKDSVILPSFLQLGGSGETPKDYQPVGTWQAIPVLDDEDYEEVDV